MREFTKAERKTLRDLAGRVYEADAHAVLEQLEHEFLRWRGGEVESSELLAAIHEFHQGLSRELWSRYQALKDPEIVARGVAMGWLNISDLPEKLRTELEPLVELFCSARAVGHVIHRTASPCEFIAERRLLNVWFLEIKEAGYNTAISRG